MLTTAFAVTIDPAYFVAVAGLNLDTQTDEQGNPVKNRNTAGLTCCAVSTEPFSFLRKQVIGET